MKLSVSTRRTVANPLNVDSLVSQQRAQAQASLEADVPACLTKRALVEARVRQQKRDRIYGKRTRAMIYQRTLSDPMIVATVS